MTSLPRPCLEQGCPETVVDGSRCDAHRRERERERPTSTARGYDATWRKIRLRKLTKDPFCEWCGEAANEVDHRDGNPANNHPSNLRSACKPCHSRRTARDQAFGRGGAQRPVEARETRGGVAAWTMA